MKGKQKKYPISERSFSREKSVKLGSGRESIPSKSPPAFRQRNDRIRGGPTSFMRDGGCPGNNGIKVWG